ncbi:MAG TPA: phosphatase PAP2 family protein [Opitutaceae bacterium]|nr:phosphatase PAP2 family protein [Opitutaceae bacterium]
MPATLLRAQPAAPAPAASIPDYGRIVWHEAGYVFTAPVRWDQTDWLEFGGATAAVAGTAVLLDQPVRDAARRNRGSTAEHFANNFERFGAEYSFGVIGAFYLGGLAGRDDRAKVVAEDGLAASLFSGSVAFAVKEAAGRSRPNANRGVFHFSPFSGNASFPSGHATQAFTVASVIAAHYDDNPWIDSAAYGLAALVGVARIDHNAHFASDVLAGALLGNAVGRMVVHYRASAPSNVSFSPVIAPCFAGFSVGLTF